MLMVIISLKIEIVEYVLPLTITNNRLLNFAQGRFEGT